ncbi:serine hydrolase domain-containing protein, partial [Microbacterium sp.]
MTTSSAPLPRSTPSAQGVDAAGVERLLDAAAERGIELHSLMVLRHGSVIAEGWWAPYTAEQPNLVYSLSKTFTSAAAGFAVAEGLFSLDDRMVDHFPDLVPEGIDDKYRRYLVRHALSMSSGHEQETLDRATAEADSRGGDLLASFFAVPPEHEPGSVFTYNQPTIYGVGRLVGRTSEQGLLEYLRPRLLEPLGIDEAQWMLIDGFEMGFSGIHVRTESLAKTGQLMLDRGRWGDRQLLDEEWVDAATRVQTPNDTADRAPGGAVEPVDWRQGYGFQYWRSRHGYRGDGAFGQFVIIWPEEDAVIVTTAETVDMAGLLEEITTHLRPAMSGAGTEAADDALGERLAGLALPLPEDTGADFSGAVHLAQEPGEVGPFSSGVAAPGVERAEVVAARRG